MGRYHPGCRELAVVSTAQLSEYLATTFNTWSVNVLDYLNISIKRVGCVGLQPTLGLMVAGKAATRRVVPVKTVGAGAENPLAQFASALGFALPREAPDALHGHPDPPPLPPPPAVGPGGHNVNFSQCYMYPARDPNGNNNSPWAAEYTGGPNKKHICLSNRLG
jgi:hypothetical protein